MCIVGKTGYSVTNVLLFKAKIRIQSYIYISMHVCMSCRLQTHSYVCIYQALIANPLDLAQSLAVHVQTHTITFQENRFHKQCHGELLHYPQFSSVTWACLIGGTHHGNIYHMRKINFWN